MLDDCYAPASTSSAVDCTSWSAKCFSTYPSQPHVLGNICRPDRVGAAPSGANASATWSACQQCGLTAPVHPCIRGTCSFETGQTAEERRENSTGGEETADQGRAPQEQFFFCLRRPGQIFGGQAGEDQAREGRYGSRTSARKISKPTKGTVGLRRPTKKVP